MLTSGLVVLDTNVLLNLYRYGEKAREELFGLLERLREVIWIPHQVLAEFWRNRERVIEDPDRRAEKTLKELESYRRSAIEKVHQWANRLVLTADERDGLSEAIHEGFAKTMESIQTLAAASAVSGGHAALDPIVERLADILKGRVGAPLSPEEHKAAVEEGLRRVQRDEPPGFRDKWKSPRPETQPAGRPAVERREGGSMSDAVAGDFLIWEQVIREAERRNGDVLLVTGDAKPDWWREEGGQLRGPRPELAREMRSRAGARLIMLRPESLLLHAGRVLDFVVSEESLTEVERVAREALGLSTGDVFEGEAVFVGWDYALILTPIGRNAILHWTKLGRPSGEFVDVRNYLSEGQRVRVRVESIDGSGDRIELALAPENGSTAA